MKKSSTASLKRFSNGKTGRKQQKRQIAASENASEDSRKAFDLAEQLSAPVIFK